MQNDNEPPPAVALTPTSRPDMAQEEMVRNRLASIVDNSDDAILSKTLHGIITSWNRGAERIFGYSAEEAIGKHKTLVFPPELFHEEDEILCRVQRGEPIDHFESIRVRKDGRQINVSVTVSPIRDSQGTIVGASTIARDITEARRQQQEMLALNARLRRAMQETHHRIKNNLQLIAAILDLTLLDHPTLVPADELKRLSQQVMTLAGIHNILTREATEGDEADTLLSTQEVLTQLLILLEQSAHPYRLTYEIEDMRLPIKQVTSLAMSINELVLHATKHERKQIHVSFRKAGTLLRLVVEDNGPALPDTFDLHTDSNGGLSVVANLAEQDLGGRLAFEHSPAGGAHACLTFAMPETPRTPQSASGGTSEITPRRNA